MIEHLRSMLGRSVESLISLQSPSACSKSHRLAYLSKCGQSETKRGARYMNMLLHGTYQYISYISNDKDDFEMFIRFSYAVLLVISLCFPMVYDSTFCVEQAHALEVK